MFRTGIKKRPPCEATQDGQDKSNTQMCLFLIITRERRKGKKLMTISEIRATKKLFLTPVEVAPVLRCDPQCIRLTARTAPEQLGFPVICVGTRTKIPRIPFLRALGYEEETA